jgi:hypothetical protein
MDNLAKRMKPWADKIGQKFELVSKPQGSNDLLSFTPAEVTPAEWVFGLHRNNLAIGQGQIYIGTDGEYGLDLSLRLGNADVFNNQEMIKKEILMISRFDQVFLIKREGIVLGGTRKSLEMLKLSPKEGEWEQKATRDDYLTDLWINVSYYPEEPVINVNRPQDVGPVMRLLRKLHPVVSITLEVTEGFADRYTTDTVAGCDNSVDHEYLFPVYEEGVDTTEFFVSPTVVSPTAVCYSEADRYGRKDHLTQFLTLPLNVPNYMGLCQVPGQEPWTLMSEVDPTSMRVLKMLIQVDVGNESKNFFINTTTRFSASFVRGVIDDRLYTLFMQLLNFGGFSIEDASGAKIGETIFANFKAAGYEPLFKFSLNGSYDRQLCRLRMTGSPSEIDGLLNIKTGDVIYTHQATQEQLALMKSVTSIDVKGFRLQQMLK